MDFFQKLRSVNTRHAEAVARRGEKGMCRSHTRPGIGVERRNLRKVLAVAARQFAASMPVTRQQCPDLCKDYIYE